MIATVAVRMNEPSGECCGLGLVEGNFAWVKGRRNCTCRRGEVTYAKI